jgi:hypothetical protein
MENVLPFSRGDILVQPAAPELFAIFGGIRYVSEDGGGVDYSLIAYCDSDERVDLLAVDTENSIDCNYVIFEKDISAWRKANKNEIQAVCVYLYKRGYAYNTKTHKIKQIGKKKAEKGFLYDDLNYEVNEPETWETPKPISQMENEKEKSLRLLCANISDKKIKDDEKNAKEYYDSLTDEEEKKNFLALCAAYGFKIKK